MRLARSLDRMRDSRALTRAVGVGSAMVVIALVGVELVAPHDLTFGAAQLVPLVAAWALVERRMAVAILVLAAAGRVVDAAAHDIPLGLAVVEVISYIAVFALIAIVLDPGLRNAGRDPVASGREAEAAGSSIEHSLVPDSVPTASGENALTTRERQVVELTARGLTAAQIAQRLAIGRRTVETHLAHAYGKLGVRTKHDLVAQQFERDAPSP
jgi:DNA-binding CsgD family transcriptional regulator